MEGVADPITIFQAAPMAELAWRTAAPFEKPLGSANGIRNRVEADPNEINNLQAETVGSQTLSLRHFTSANSYTASMCAGIPFDFKRVWQVRPYF
jgi:hypothetical protein